MFNWYSLPAFGAMLVFWLLATYTASRSWRHPVARLAVGFETAASAYLLGQGMQANAATLSEWLPWSRNFDVAGIVVLPLWYWLTLFILREQTDPHRASTTWRLRYGFGATLIALATLLIVEDCLGDNVERWSEPVVLPIEQSSFGHFDSTPGPLYGVLVGLVVLATIGAALNLLSGSRFATTAELRALFHSLMVSAVLFIGGATLEATTGLLDLVWFPLPLIYLVYAAAIILIAVNVAVYSLVHFGRLPGANRRYIHADLRYFLFGMIPLCLIYTSVFILSGIPYTFQILEILVSIVLLAVFSHSLADVARGLLDRLFFQPEVRELRNVLRDVAQRVVMTSDLESSLGNLDIEIQSRVSHEQITRLTEGALRALHNVEELSRSELIAHLPNALEKARLRLPDDTHAPAMHIQQARALQQILLNALESLRPIEREDRLAARTTLLYDIIRGEYVLGHAVRQIATRHHIAEATLYRRRKEAIKSIARELIALEDSG
jgi:hypothetical protein